VLIGKNYSSFIIDEIKTITAPTTQAEPQRLKSMAGIIISILELLIDPIRKPAHRRKPPDNSRTDTK